MTAAPQGSTSAGKQRSGGRRRLLLSDLGVARSRIKVDYFPGFA